MAQILHQGMYLLAVVADFLRFLCIAGERKRLVGLLLISLSQLRCAAPVTSLLA